MKVLKVALIVIGVLVAASIIFIAWATIPRSTTKVEAVANQFKPGKGWTLREERITPYKPLCLQADCDEVRRIWSVSEPITSKAEFLAAISSVRDLLKVEEESCLVSPYTGEVTKSCSAHGVVGGYDVAVNYSHDDTIGPMIILQVE